MLKRISTVYFLFSKEGCFISLFYIKICSSMFTNQNSIGYCLNIQRLTKNLLEALGGKTFPSVLLLIFK